MSKTEFFVLTSLGFVIFEIIFIRTGFFFGMPIGQFTLLSSFLMYCGVLAFIYSLNFFPQRFKSGSFIGLGCFVLFIIALAGISWLLSYTYDTSWDGQGYHQTAIISMANGWNPIQEPLIHLKQRLPSQIFAEGYPSALWEIQASIYAFSGWINAAKVMNIAIGIISGTFVFILLRKLLFNRLLAVVISVLIVLQPVYLIQFLTYMQDGFGYQLLVAAVATLVILIIDMRAYWAIAGFVMTGFMLVSTKYSHLPVALMLGIIFLLVIMNRLMNKEYFMKRNFRLSLVGIIIFSFFFGFLPYVRNGLAHNAPFYPTNIPDLMGSVAYNNVPNNLNKNDKFSLLFYGIFSRSQVSESGDPRNKENVAILKLPFAFSMEEVSDSASLYNNRVGAAGPLFSGILVLSLLFLSYVSFRTKSKKQRYAVYASFFCLTVIFSLSLFTPAPNLLRYVSQVQLLPFVVVIPIYAKIRNGITKTVTFFILGLISLNLGLYSYAVFEKNRVDTQEMNKQFAEMKSSGQVYQVGAQQFYSNYLLLSELNVPFVSVDYLRCNDRQKLYASSNTTHFCPN